MNAVLDAIKATSDAPTLGTLPKEKPEGTFAATWQGVLDGSGLPTVDVAAGLGECFSCKDPEEVKNVKKAAHLSASAMVKFAVPEIEEIIDSERRVKHSKLSEKTEEAITNPVKIQVKLRDDNVDIAYPPIFQSGGEYDLKVRVCVFFVCVRPLIFCFWHIDNQRIHDKKSQLTIYHNAAINTNSRLTHHSAPSQVSAQSNDSTLHYGVIIASLGARYSMYCANVARTYLVDPTAQQEKEYTALLEAQQAAIAALVEGAPMSAPYTAAAQSLQVCGCGCCGCGCWNASLPLVLLCFYVLKIDHQGHQSQPTCHDAFDGKNNISSNTIDISHDFMLFCPSDHIAAGVGVFS